MRTPSPNGFTIIGVIGSHTRHRRPARQGRVDIRKDVGAAPHQDLASRDDHDGRCAVLQHGQRGPGRGRGIEGHDLRRLVLGASRIGRAPAGTGDHDLVAGDQHALPIREARRLGHIGLRPRVRVGIVAEQHRDAPSGLDALSKQEQLRAAPEQPPSRALDARDHARIRSTHGAPGVRCRIEHRALELDRAGSAVAVELPDRDHLLAGPDHRPDLRIQPRHRRPAVGRGIVERAVGRVRGLGLTPGPSS